MSNIITITYITNNLRGCCAGPWRGTACTCSPSLRRKLLRITRFNNIIIINSININKVNQQKHKPITNTNRESSLWFSPAEFTLARAPAPGWWGGWSSSSQVAVLTIIMFQFVPRAYLVNFFMAISPVKRLVIPFLCGNPPQIHSHFPSFHSFTLSGNSPVASALRDRFVFKIVPMLNPDGVIIGNTRSFKYLS